MSCLPIVIFHYLTYWRSLLADLPDKARALLYTVDTLPKGGGLETSRWASEEDIVEIKARRAAGGYDSYHKRKSSVSLHISLSECSLYDSLYLYAQS